MSRHLFVLSLSCLLLIFTAFTPHAASAEGEPTPEPVQPPWITGQNTEVTTGSEPAIASEPAGVVVDSPELVGLAPQDEVALSGKLVQLAVPQRTQDPDDPTCGAAALGMALEFLSLTEGGEAPDTAALIKDLDASGFLYQTGTGVEELAALARSYGYRGASPFHGWSLEKLAGELASGHPVVVSLGLNGENQPGHFVTLTGMAADGSWVAYNDPVLGEQTLSAEEFLAAWGSQGYSGLAVRKGALAAASDPLLPWLGLLGAVSTLAVLARSYPLGSEFKNLLAGIQSLLADPRRKGLGGRLATMAGGGGNSSSPPHSAPAGYHWEKKVSPKYGWKDHLVTKTRQVPIMVEKKVKVGTKVWYEDVARYRDVRVDRGRYAWRKVTNYKREKYVRYYRTTRVKKTHWVRRGYRFVPQTYYVTKRTPVYGYRNVPNGIRWERYWKSNWVTEKQFDGYTRVRHEQDIYETRRVPTGRYRTEYYTDNVPVYEQVGTTVNWELKKDPTPTPTPTLNNPTPTPSNPTVTTTAQSTPTAIPLYPTLGSSPTSTLVPSATETSTPSATPSATSQEPSTTPTTPEPTPHYPTTIITGEISTQEFTATCTPEPPPTGTATQSATPDWTPSSTPVPFDFDPAATQIAGVKTGVDFVRKTAYPTLNGLLGGGWPNNYQTGGLASGLLNGSAAVLSARGVDDYITNWFRLGAKGADTYFTQKLTNSVMVNSQLPTRTQSINSAVNAASAQSGIINQTKTVAGSLVDDFSNQLTAMSVKVISASPALRVLQGIGAAGGLVGGVYQVGNGTAMRNNEDPYDDTLGFVQSVGGIATVAGSAVTLAAMVPAVAAAVPAVIGAAPVLLAVGAIAAGGVLVYDLFKDTPAVNTINQAIEDSANQEGGFVDDAISEGQSMVENGVLPAFAITAAIVDSTMTQSAESIKSTVQGSVNLVQSTASDVKDYLSDTYQPVINAADKVKQTVSIAISSVTSPALDTLSSAGETINNTSSQILDGFTDAVSKASNFVGNIFNSG